MTDTAIPAVYGDLLRRRFFGFGTLHQDTHDSLRRAVGLADLLYCAVDIAVSKDSDLGRPDALTKSLEALYLEIQDALTLFEATWEAYRRLESVAEAPATLNDKNPLGDESMALDLKDELKQMDLDLKAAHESFTELGLDLEAVRSCQARLRRAIQAAVLSEGQGG